MLNLYFSVIYESVLVFFYSSAYSPFELNMLFLNRFSRNPEFAAAVVVCGKAWLYLGLLWVPELIAPREGR